MTETIASPVLHRANRKATVRLVPVLALLLFVNYLDRVNIGFAAPTMNKDLGMSTATYGIGVALFFTGYIVLEIPSNYVMFRVGARRWLARIGVTWGVVAALHALVVGPGTFAAARILLGIAEAGLLPGILLYIALWFAGAQRVAVLGLYYVAVPLSTAIGGPVSNWLIGVGSTFGVDGWRVMFAVEGVAAVALGVAVLFALPDRPELARWLTTEEATALRTAVADHAEGAQERHSFTRALRSGTTLRLAAVFFLLTFPMFAISFFLPLMTAAVTRSGGSGAVDLVTLVPFTLGALASYGWSRFVRRRGLRPWHYAAPAALAAIAVLLCAFAGSSFPLLFTGVALAAIGIYGGIPVFWSIATGRLSGAAAAAGLALINTVGSLGGFVAGYFTGWFHDLTGGYQAPFLVMACALLASALLAITTLTTRRTSHAA